MENNRKLARKSLGQQCWIRPGTNQIHAVALIEISQAGAKLALRTPVELPNHVDLLLTRDGKVGRRAEIVWKTDKELELTFVSRAIAPLTAAECEPDDDTLASELVSI